jgi:hypothetical protein
VNECRRLTYSGATAASLNPLPAVQPPAQPPAKIPPRKNKKKKGGKGHLSPKISPVQRLASDLTKKDDAAQPPGAEQPDRDGTMPDPVNPDTVPGRDDAFKVVTATVTAPKGGAVCSTGACEMTGAPSSSAPSTTPPLSGEKNLNSSPPEANYTAVGAQNSAPDGTGSFRPDQTQTVEEETRMTTPLKSNQIDVFRTPTACDTNFDTQLLPSQLLEEFDPSSPVSVAIERIEHNIVSAHIRHQTYGKDKPKVPENLAELM